MHASIPTVTPSIYTEQRQIDKVRDVIYTNAETVPYYDVEMYYNFLQGMNVVMNSYIAK
jgi:hypothetical protein